MYVNDTIAAISTPVGEGGIGVIRVSGALAIPLAESIFRKHRNGGLLSHRFYYGAIVDPDSADTLDEAMVVVMRAPHSYTREDVLEIQCHGGYLLVQKVMDLVLRSGARLAEPGEFTKRAFLNGRIDLVQAEAVIDLIRSKTDVSLALARHQSEGLLSRRIAAAKEGIVTALAYLEAFIDFPDEDIDSSGTARLTDLIGASLDEIAALLDGFNEGRVLRDGVSVVIAGKPNVGKSSLLNTLLQEKRAIVTSIPGTTRDIIEEVVSIRGLPIRLLDTAGIRETADQVEQEGVSRARDRLSSADLVLFVVDGSRPFTAEDEAVLATLTGRTFLFVSNKADLPLNSGVPAELADRRLCISTLTGQGIEALKEEIYATFIHGRAIDSREYVTISQVRHRDALTRARDCLGRFTANFAAGINLELLSIDLREALSAVGEVTGETTADDVLDRIFSSFCIGK
jgi:tRNA modification GTPase